VEKLEQQNKYLESMNQFLEDSQKRADEERINMQK
jgi:hypothetical protein